MNELNFKDELDQKIMKLSENIWENKVKRPTLQAWLDNFQSDTNNNICEQTHALYLLSNFTYFGVREIREMLKSVFRDKVKNPLIHKIRKNLGDSINPDEIYPVFENEMTKTKFIGIGNPSESGTHLLYFFRQENELPKDVFVHSHQLVNLKRIEKGNNTVTEISLGFPDTNRYIFLDDICGSGQQVISYMSNDDTISSMKDINPNIELIYITLVASKKGLDAVKSSNIFDRVETIFELDDSYKCFSDNSRYFPQKASFPVNKGFAEGMSAKYGRIMLFSEEHVHGYKNGQYLFGFSHNIPDNTLPVIWFDKDWSPILKRYSKLY